MDQLSDRVRHDFDLIADLPEEGWNHNRHYHDWILRQLPRRLESVLEVGCGKGGFGRRLASRSRYVVGIDFSPRMIERARAECHDLPNVKFVLGDFHTWEGPAHPIDAIISIATLHHLDPTVFANRARELLQPGGMLVVVDLRRDGGVIDRSLSAVAAVLSLFIRLMRTAHLRPSDQSRAVWNKHAEVDHFLSYVEAKILWQRLLPGSVVRRHLFWRYSVVWQKPSG